MIPEPCCIATIDPGIDVASIAFWRPEFAKPDLYGAAFGLVAIKSIRTQVEQSSVERCASLFNQAQLAFASYRPEVVFIEMPPAWHGAREGGRQRQTASQKVDMAKLNRAIGAIAAAAGVNARVVEVPASRMKKKIRLEHALRACKEVRKASPERPLPKNEDERSAVWIGLEVISTGLWRDYVQPVIQAAG